MKILTTAMLLSLARPLCGGHALAQQTQTQIAVSGGVVTDQRGVRSSAIAFAPTLTLQSSSVALQLGGNATRFATQLWSIGGSATVHAREPLGRFAALTLTASGSASRLASDASASFATGDIVPALEASLGPVTVYGGARAATGHATQPGVAAGPPPIIGGPNPRSVNGTATSAARLGPVYGAVLRLAGDAGAVQLSARHEPADGTAAGVTASLPIARDISFEVGAGSYPVNHLLNTPEGSYATAGLSLRFGGARRPSLPKPAGVRAPPPGMTRLALRAPDARGVEVAGDFTEWKFVAASRAANGVWYADLRIPPGQYRYAFRINGTEWRVPDGATAVDDGFGGTSAWITVPGRDVGR